MGAALFDRFADLAARADEILGYSVRDLCVHDPHGHLKQTQFTQPAVFVVNAFAYLNKLAEGGREPDYLIGHSLGELNALLAAGCFDFELGVRVVRKRAELMSQSSAGAMAAVMNARAAQIEQLLLDNGFTTIDLANYNTPSQIVISGTEDEITRAEEIFTAAGYRYALLNTSGAFHSRLMRPAQERFGAYLRGIALADPKIPVISNATALPYGASQVQMNLTAQIASTVRWLESIQYLRGIGSAAAEVMEFEEVGHGEVLTKLLNNIRQHMPDPPKSAPGEHPPHP
jgi:malonyl CoA-acyl carrier protein transacylase